jgi:hypothetical protein
MISSLFCVVQRGFVEPCKNVPMQNITLSRAEISKIFTRFFSPKMFADQRKHTRSSSKISIVAFRYMKHEFCAIWHDIGHTTQDRKTSIFVIRPNFASSDWILCCPTKTFLSSDIVLHKIRYSCKRTLWKIISKKGMIAWRSLFLLHWRQEGKRWCWTPRFCGHPWTRRSRTSRPRTLRWRHFTMDQVRPSADLRQQTKHRNSFKKG